VARHRTAPIDDEKKKVFFSITLYSLHHCEEDEAGARISFD
jgi:hypothetical protein